MKWILLYLIFHAACGAFNYGRMLAHFQQKYPTLADKHYQQDVAFAALGALIGPYAVPATLLVCDSQYEFQWK